jgi:anti-anti-sigma factor
MTHADRSPRRRTTEPVLDSQVSYRLGVPLIYVKGELGHDSAEQLRSVIDQELAACPPALILDLSELLFIDSGGLSIMFNLVRRFSDPGWLAVVGANQGIARLLEATGLLDHPNFRVFSDAAAAAAALAAAGPTEAAH